MKGETLRISLQVMEESMQELVDSKKKMEENQFFLELLRKNGVDTSEWIQIFQAFQKLQARTLKLLKKTLIKIQKE